MKFGKGHAGQHDIAPASNRGFENKAGTNPLKGLLIMLGSCIVFLAFLGLLTVAVHFIML